MADTWSQRLLPGLLASGDLAAFRAVGALRAPALDTSLPRLSHAANHSRLWLGAALLLATTAGRLGRRAALRGLVAVTLASATANLPVKLSVRRARSPIDLVPVIRRLRRRPTSWSLPSGHSASAAAFATGTALELPAAGVPLGLLAAAVGFSRVYTGAHYPMDVVAGAFLGVGAAWSTTRWWPLAPTAESASPARLHPGHVPPSPRGDGLVCCVNVDAGALWAPGRGAPSQVGLTRAPATAVEQGLPGSRVVRCAGEQLPDLLERLSAGARAVGVAGGDGSVNAAAEIAHRRRLPLLVLPTGSFNRFARDLGLDGPQDAFAAVRSGETVAVDLATVAGRPFLNVASLGGYAALVDARRRLERRIGSGPHLLWGLLGVLRHGTLERVEIDGRPRRLWLLYAGNCRYQPDGFAPAGRPRLDDGALDLRLVDADTPWARGRLVLSVLSGRMGRCRAYERRIVRRVRVRSLDGPLRLVRDGEPFQGPVAFEIRREPDTLAVFAGHRA